MEWQLDANAPIYSQLIESLELAIVAGQFSPGERLPSVRDMALEAGVNPNTMQRALQELERNGLVFSQRTAGRFVTEEKRLIDEAKKALAGKNIRSFLDAMSRLGYGKEEIIALIRSDTGEAMANANI
jgi:GntR family transcriptional regulator